MKPLIAVIALTVAFFLPAHAEKEPTPEQIALIQKRMKAIGELQYQSGVITLAGGKVKVALPPEFKYLDSANAKRVWVDVFGNPPNAGRSDGMIVPKDINFRTGEGWLAELLWKEDGYVKDDDFAKLNFNDMLKELKEAAHRESEERVKGGYGKMELASWAEQPHYDRTTHKLYYAKLFDTDGSEQQLNYDIRVMGRHGVLEVSIATHKSEMQRVVEDAPKILSIVDFTEGNRYTDYKPGTDKVATYGIAGLIVGGVLAKAGFFKVIFAALIAAKKFVIIAIIAIGAWIKRLMGGKKAS